MVLMKIQIRVTIDKIVIIFLYLNIMTKEEFIKKYGIEKYNRRLELTREINRKRRLADPEWERNRSKKKYQKLKEKLKTDPELKTKLSVERVRNKQRSYVENGRIDLIENYELAKADNFDGWEIHHKIELHPDGSTRFTSKSLKDIDLYYNRPANELIWMTTFEHNSIHHKQVE